MAAAAVLKGLPMQEGTDSDLRLVALKMPGPGPADSEVFQDLGPEPPEDSDKDCRCQWHGVSMCVQLDFELASVRTEPTVTDSDSPPDRPAPPHTHDPHHATAEVRKGRGQTGTRRLFWI